MGVLGLILVLLGMGLMVWAGTNNENHSKYLLIISIILIVLGMLSVFFMVF